MNDIETSNNKETSLPPAKATFTADDVKAVLFGVAVGDALGVPVEFSSREALRKNPVTDMMGYGTYDQPPGTNEISGSGYVVHALEASIWCLLTTATYREAVLKAVNLGKDTDTTAAITGGLAGLLYGYENIPVEWRQKIARHDDIERLAEKVFSFKNG